MSITYASERNILSKEIPTSNTSLYEPYVRPSEWLTMPTVGLTDHKFAGLVAIYNDDSNYVTFTAGTTIFNSFTANLSNGLNTAAGNILTARVSPQPTLTVGMYLSGASILDPYMTVTGINLANFTATASGTTLTVTAVSSGVIAPGMTINGYPVYITAYGTGTGGTGTYTLSGTATGSITSAQSFTVSSSSSWVSNSTVMSSPGIDVDWGDGTVERFAGNTTRLYHKYNYATINNSTLTSYGYKQAIVSVTPVIGHTLLSFSLQNALPVNNVVTPGINWLDIILGSPTVSTISIGGNALTVLFPMLEKSTLVSKFPAYVPSQIYRQCWSLQEAVFGDGFMNSAVTSTAFWFGSCFKLKNAPDIPLSYVTNMAGMFNLCYNLKYVPTYDTSNVNDMSSTFQGCTSLESLPLLNTIKVQNFSTTFDSCRSITSIPYFNTSNATNTTGMFGSCVSIPTIPLIDTSNVTTATNMFSGCTNLREVPLLNTSNVTTMTSMFSNCSALETIPLIDTSKSTNTSAMFSGCSSLEYVPNFNTANVANMASMFSGCNSLLSAPSINTYASTNFTSMYQNCFSLRGNIVIDKTSGSGTFLAGTIFAGATLVDSLTINVAGTATNTSLTTSLQNARSIKSANFGNCASVTSATTFMSNTNTLKSLRVPNMPISFNTSQTMLSKDAMEIVFSDLAPNATSQTMVISATPAADTPISSTMVAGTTAGTFTVQVANTAGYQVGMYVTNSACFADSTFTFSSANWRFTKTSHGLLNGEPVSITGATVPTGITRYAIYYVINRTSNDFQVSTTPGGSAVSFSTSGSTTLRNAFKINSIVDSTTLVLNAPITATTTATALNGRMLNTYIATLKNWTITG